MPLTPGMAATEVERHACPTCAAPAGRPCRTRGGNTAHRYHTPRFILVPELRSAPEVLVPPDRGPGHPWVPEPPSTVEQTAAPFRVGYAHTAPAQRAALRDQIDTLGAAQCRRVFSETTSPLTKPRPELDNALRLAATHRPAVLTVVALNRLARNASELMAVAGTLHHDDSALEVLSGALAGVHRPDSPFFAVLAAATGLDRDDRRERTSAGQHEAAARGRPAGRPRALDDGMVARARAWRDEGVPVPDIVDRLTIASGENAGRRPSIASVYRALRDAAPQPVSVAGHRP